VKFKWDKKYLYWGVTAFCVVVASIFFFRLLSQWPGFTDSFNLIVKVLSPFIYGFVIAYILNNIVSFFNDRLFSKPCRKIFKKTSAAAKAAKIFSIILTELLALGVIAGILVLALPQIYYSIAGIVENSSSYLDSAMAWLQNAEFLEGSSLGATAISWFNTAYNYLLDWISTSLLPQITTLITSITGGVISIIKEILNFVIGVVISVYVLYNKDTLKAQGKKLLYCVLKPKTANAVMDEVGHINTAFENYITGTLIDATIIGVANTIFMLIMGMPHIALISILVAVTNLIPVFGPFIGAIPSTLLILLESPTQALIFVIFTLVLQQIDGNILKPQIHGSKSGLSGFWVMFAILFFGGLFGIVGMIIGVPLLSVIYNAVSRLSTRRLKRRNLPPHTEDYKNIHRISPETGEPVYKAKED